MSCVQGGVVNRAGTGLVEKVEFKEWVTQSQQKTDDSGTAVLDSDGRPVMEDVQVEQAITDPAKKEIRLIPFLETEEESYVLEFTDSRIRVLRNGAYVKDKDGNTLEITNRDYLYNELAKIRYDQKNSFMTFVHRDNSPKQIELRSGVFTLLEYLQQSGAEGTVEQSSLRVWLPYLDLQIARILIFMLEVIILSTMNLMRKMTLIMTI